MRVRLNVDGTGQARVRTGIGYLDHMVVALATHAVFDITLHAKGDLVHHITEDVAIALGTALSRALGNREGIYRFGAGLAPMDDALAWASVDLVRRPYCAVDLHLDKEGVEDLPREDLMHFLRSFAFGAEATVHVGVQYGENDHHKSEAAFKALALALRQAVARDPRRRTTPSAKGVM